MKKWVTFMVVVSVCGALAWTRSPSAAGEAQATPAVQLIPPGQKQAGSPGEKGSTYYALEAQTTKLTTTFKDGHVAVAERGLIGDVTTTVKDRAGNERGRLRLNRIDGSHDMLNYEPAGGPAFQALSNPAVARPTLDWTARQSYAFAIDGTANLVWDGGTMRPRNVGRHNVEKDIDGVETEWANGLVARLSRQTYSPRTIAPGKTVRGSALVSELTQHGTPVGTAAWFEEDQVLAYALPGLMTGLVVIGRDDLKADYGGWPFTPDSTWLNLQLIAAHHFKTQLVKQGTVAKACEPPKQNRLAQFFMPTVYANEPGCDDLHWLDGSIVRACCDDHDRCYAKAGCSSSSWWRVWTSWTCDFCNMAVVGCFFARGTADERCITRQGCAG
jgi:hypothetical protein